MLDRDKQFFDAYGFAGPFSLDDLDLVRAFEGFVRGYKHPGQLNWVLSKLRVAPDRRLGRRHGHIAFAPIYDLATRQRLLDDVETLLGPDILLWKGRILSRGPGDAGQSWHVDRDNMLVNGVHISIAITDMTAQNGCLQLVPGTHKYGVSLQENSRRGACDLHDPESILALADRTHPENAPHKLVTMELKQGEYFLTRGGLWHGVLPNTTTDMRVSLVARYMRPDVQSHHWSHDDSTVKVLSRKSQPCILVRGTDQHRLNKLHAPPAAGVDHADVSYSRAQHAVSVSERAKLIS